MYCGNCGAKLPDDAKFCGNCGTAMPDGGFAVPAEGPAPASGQPDPYWQGMLQQQAAPAASQPVDAARQAMLYEQQAAQASYPPAQAQPAAADGDGGTLKLVAFIFCVISCVALGALIVPLAWAVPMTVHAWKVYKGEAECTTAFAVCTLIFVNMVSGILLLVDDNG